MLSPSSLPSVFWTESAAKRSPAASHLDVSSALDEGEIEVDSIEPIGSPDITPELAGKPDFLGVLDLLKVAKHGKGEKNLSRALSLCCAASAEFFGKKHQQNRVSSS